MATQLLGLPVANALSERVAIRVAKQSINEGYDLDADGAIALENKLFGQCFATKDQKEGMDAFLNKRKADFIGE